jgi:hypothetical protein
MRVTCPACRAPFTVLDELAAEPGKCPNCERECVPANHPRRAPVPTAETAGDGRSRALTVAGLLHFLYAAVGLCTAAGLADYVRQIGPEAGDGLYQVGAVVATAHFTIASGVGLLLRRRLAGYTGLSVGVLLTLIGLRAAAGGNLIGGGFWFLVGSYIAAVVIVRWGELE